MGSWARPHQAETEPVSLPATSRDRKDVREKSSSPAGLRPSQGSKSWRGPQSRPQRSGPQLVGAKKLGWAPTHANSPEGGGREENQPPTRVPHHTYLGRPQEVSGGILKNKTGAGHQTEAPLSPCSSHCACN